MAAPKLTKEQKAQVLQMLAEGETQETIAETVGCAQPNVAYYANLHKAELDAAWEVYKQQAISRGYGNREYRINKLGKLASRINGRLEESLEAEEVKISSTGQTVRYNIFNAPEVAAYRAILDDIAKELGGPAT